MIHLADAVLAFGMGQIHWKAAFICAWMGEENILASKGEVWRPCTNNDKPPTNSYVNLK